MIDLKGYLAYDYCTESPDLILAILAQTGGQEKFVDNCKEMAETKVIDGVAGWDDDSKLVAFYYENRRDILSVVRASASFRRNDSPIRMVQDFVGKPSEFSIDEVAQVLYMANADDYVKHEVDNERYADIAAGLAKYAYLRLCESYNGFVQQKAFIERVDAMKTDSDAMQMSDDIAF